MKPQHESPAHHEPSTTPSGRKKRFPFVSLAVLAASVTAAFFYVSAQRSRAADEVVQMTHELAITPVQVINPATSTSAGEVVLPGDVVPYADTLIFARTDGYVKRWLVDIGAPVKQGELLVELEAPELDQQVEQARSVVAQAKAKAELAVSSNTRWQSLVTRQVVSQQEADEKASDLAATKADLEAAEANLSRLEQLKSFQLITAPFDGRVTARSVEVGDRITSQGGTSASRPELYRITQDNILRVYLSVPETYAAQIREGQSARVTLASAPGIELAGKVVRTSGAIHQQSRTLLTEVQVDNSHHRYLAGGYATVHIPLPASSNPNMLPVNTLLFRPEGTLVGVAVGRSDKCVAQLRKIKLGRDLGTQIEVTSGLQASDQVILNPSDSLRDGESIRVLGSR